ncbi:MAG: PAS domain-containing protein, partial [Flammeovirgaceae bacterium]
DIRHIRASANTIVDNNGEAVFLFGINWDVTHFVQAQEKITESNKRYTLASKASQDGIWI